VVVPVGAHQVGQQLGVTRVRLGAGNGMPLAVAAGGQRVDRIDLVAEGHQGLHEQPPVELDADHHVLRVHSLPRQQRMKPRQAFHPVRDALPGQHPPVLIHQTDILVGLRPIHPYKQHRHASCPYHQTEPEEDRGELMA
jgi:hypothetical protein